VTNKNTAEADLNAGFLPMLRCNNLFIVMTRACLARVLAAMRELSRWGRKVVEFAAINFLEEIFLQRRYGQDEKWLTVCLRNKLRMIRLQHASCAVAHDRLPTRRTVINTRRQGARVWTSKRFEGNA
jgi:hypothetical protein